MDKDVSHLLNRSPRRVRMQLLEISSKFIDSLTYDLHIIYGRMKMQLIFFQPLFADSIGVFLNTFYGR